MKKLMIALLMLVSIAAAQPQKGKTDDSDRPRMRRGAMMGDLNLTADQQKQFDKLQSDMQRSMIATRAKVQTLKIDLRDLFRAEKPDRAKIESKIGEISKAQNEMKLAHVGHWFDVNSILTPEQQAIWKEHRRMMGGKGFGPMGKHPMMRGRGPGRMMQHGGMPGDGRDMMEKNDDDMN